MGHPSYRNLDQHRAVQLDGVSDGSAHVPRLVDLHALDAVRLGHLDEIRVVQLGPVRPAPHVVHVTRHVAVCVVVEQHHHGINVVLHRSRKLLRGVQETTVARGDDHGLVRLRDLHAESRREGVSKVSGVTGCEEAAGSIGLPVRPAVVADLSHPADEERIFRRVIPDGLEDRALRLRVRSERISGIPNGADLIGGRFPGAAVRLQSIEHGPQSRARVPGESVDIVVSADLFGIDIQLDNRLVRPDAGSYEARADGEDHIRCLQVFDDRAARAESRADGQRVTAVDRSLAFAGHHDPCLQMLGDRPELVMSVAQVHAAACEDNRTLGGRQHLDGLFYVLRGRRGL